MRLLQVDCNAEALREEFDVRVTSVHDPISTLSGGNQQKAILARELSRPLKVLVASQPTRGLDVGSIEFVHSRIVEERDKGTAVVVISTELDEVVALADRIAVMYRGRIVGVVPADTPRDVLGLMMAGVPESEARATTAAHTSTSQTTPISNKPAIGHKFVTDRETDEGQGGINNDKPTTHTTETAQRQEEAQ